MFILQFLKYLVILTLALLLLIFVFIISGVKVFEIETFEDDIEREYDSCIQQCGHWKNANFTNFSASDIGTCSALASSRGVNQSVITYTFYGSTTGGRQYFNGIEDNIRLLATYFPGWIIRGYHNVTHIDDVTKLCQIYCQNKNVLDICYAGDLPGFGNIFATHPFMWRFFPLVDPQVSYLMSRDLDSRLSAREAAAVTEWLQSGCPLHAMRDHPEHQTSILGGMWSAKISGYSSIWREAFDKMFQDLQNKSAFNDDQLSLTKEVFKLADIPGWMITHDSFYCRYEPFMKGEIRAFPTQREMDGKLNFIGSQTLGIDYLNKECPVPCRKHPDWKYC